MIQTTEALELKNISYITNYHQPIITRDMIKLSTIIHRIESENPVPRDTFLIRTPYSAKGMFGLAKMLAEKIPIPYNYIVQDCRGRYDSEGDFDLFNETNDTIDTMNWIENQDWSNGNVHIFGPSYMGWVALQVLQKESQAKLVSIFSPMTFSDLLDNAIYNDGVLNLHHSYPFSIMMCSRVQAPLTYLNVPFPEAYDIAIDEGMKSQGYNSKIWDLFLDKDRLAEYTINYDGDPKFSTKATFVASYYDNICRGSIKAFEIVNKIGGVKPNLIIGPWGHNGYVNSLDSVGKFKITKAQSDVSKDLIQHFQGLESKEQRVKVYVIRKDIWIQTNHWPINTSLLEFSFSLKDQKSEIRADFNEPVKTMGGPVWDNFLVKGLDPGPHDQRGINRRDDVVRLYTKEFNEEVIIAGNSILKVNASINLPKSHITAKLNLVDIDGVEYILQDGIKIIDVENSFQEIEINLDFFAFSISKGEKLMIELSWSNYPKFARPLHRKNYTITFDTSIPVSLQLEKYEP